MAERPAEAKGRPQPDARSRWSLGGGHRATGIANAEIGARLNLTAKTVANNLSSILNKLHVTQRGQAIDRAREAGGGSPGEGTK